MIAHREMVNVTSSQITFDLGADFKFFKGRNAEVIVLLDSGTVSGNSPVHVGLSAMDLLCGCMRNSVKRISDDFDTCDRGDDWESNQ